MRVHSFAAGTEDSSDLVAARIVAEHLGLEHHERVYTADEVVDVLPTVVASIESFEPSLVRSAVPNYLLSELAARHVKVVLTGEGADELFAGYDHLRDIEDADDLRLELIRSVEGLHNLNLQRCDRVTMAHGLEARVPFLDLDLIAVAQRVPIAWKLPGEEGQEKAILRQAFTGWIPDEILWRRKEQFGDGSGTAAVMTERARDLAPDDDWEKVRVPGLPRRAAARSSATSGCSPSGSRASGRPGCWGGSRPPELLRYFLGIGNASVTSRPHPQRYDAAAPGCGAPGHRGRAPRRRRRDGRAPVGRGRRAPRPCSAAPRCRPRARHGPAPRRAPGAGPVPRAVGRDTDSGQGQRAGPRHADDLRVHRARPWPRHARCHGGPPAASRRRRGARQVEPRRVRDGRHDRDLRVRRDPPPPRPDPHPGRVERRQRGRRRGRRGADGGGYRHGRVDPRACRPVRRRGGQAVARQRVPARRGPLLPQPRRRGTARRHRPRRCPAARGAGRCHRPGRRRGRRCGRARPVRRAARAGPPAVRDGQHAGVRNRLDHMLSAMATPGCRRRRGVAAERVGGAGRLLRDLVVRGRAHAGAVRRRPRQRGGAASAGGLGAARRAGRRRHRLGPLGGGGAARRGGGGLRHDARCWSRRPCP